MTLRQAFEWDHGPYKMGAGYGITDIELFLDHVHALCAQSTSPLPSDPSLSATEIISELAFITGAIEENSPIDAKAARPYFDDMARAILKFENWRTHQDTMINDEFYQICDYINMYDCFQGWARGASIYYDDLANDTTTDRHQRAALDLEEAIKDITACSLYSEALSEPWQRGEDAFYTIIGNGLYAHTPMPVWRKYAAQGAFLFAIDNLRHNQQRELDGLSHIKRTPDTHTPLSDKEREALVKFEGRYPAMQASEFGFLLDHKAQFLPYGRQLQQTFHQNIRAFNRQADFMHKQTFEPAA